MQRDPLEAVPKTSGLAEKTLLQFLDGRLVEMKISPLRQVFIAQKDIGGFIDLSGANQRARVRGAQRGLSAAASVGSPKEIVSLAIGNPVPEPLDDLEHILPHLPFLRHSLVPQ